MCVVVCYKCVLWSVTSVCCGLLQVCVVVYYECCMVLWSITSVCCGLLRVLHGIVVYYECVLWSITSVAWYCGLLRVCFVVYYEDPEVGSSPVVERLLVVQVILRWIR